MNRALIIDPHDRSVRGARHLSTRPRTTSLFFPAWGGEGFVCETLFEEELFVALPEGHRLAEQTCLRLSELAEERWITFYPPGTKRLGEDFFKACARAGFQPNVVAQVHSLEAGVTLVSEGMGITIVPRSWEPRAHRPAVKTARIDRQDLSLPTAIFWRPGQGNALRDAFLDTVRSIAEIFKDGMLGASSDENRAALRFCPRHSHAERKRSHSPELNADSENQGR